MSCAWNEQNLNPCLSPIGAASLPPAAATIPAPIACVKVIAAQRLSPPSGRASGSDLTSSGQHVCASWNKIELPHFCFCFYRCSFEGGGGFAHLFIRGEKRPTCVFGSWLSS